ncbi:MAG: hypothetical protein HY000_39785 [Planctomycetes bacterium]|nr:hypothetical protein [Planctomycetota bacterium]
MSTLLESPPSGGLLTVEVNDPIGQQSVLLEGLRPSATVTEVVNRAKAELKLNDGVDWNLREERSSRLMSERQRIGDVAGETSPHARFTMQPDAGLG